MVKQIKRLTPQKVSWQTEVYWVGIEGSVTEGPFIEWADAATRAEELNKYYRHEGYQVWTQDITLRRST